jgi:N-acyl-D-aspartate/D-glutamate deacylase
MKTALTIERQEVRKAAEKNSFSSASSAPGSEPKKRGNLANLKPWPKGVSGNPAGINGWQERHDMAAEVARAIFENNPDMVYKAFAKAIAKGNAYAFQVLADRGYGKLKESIQHEISPYHDMSEDQLRERISQLEQELGISSTAPELLPPISDPKLN